MSKAYFRALVCAGFLTLGACGGGGGTTVEATPPPPPPPASPTLPVTTSQTFETVAVTRAFDGTLTNGIELLGGVTVGTRPSTVRVSYDAAAGTYTLVDSNPPNGTNGTDTFGPANRTSAGFFDSYTLSNGSKLNLLGNVRTGGPQAGMPFQLTYLTFGIWTHSQPGPPINPPYYHAYVLFGHPTSANSMPVTGSASYQTMVDATMLEGGIYYPIVETLIGGTATFNANFGSGAITTNLNLNKITGESIGTFSGSGQIQSTNQFAGIFTSTTQNFVSGSFAGGFFGPAATEMGYGFTIHKLNNDFLAGPTPEPMHTYVTGVVVGKKQ